MFAFTSTVWMSKYNLENTIYWKNNSHTFVNFFKYGNTVKATVTFYKDFYIQKFIKTQHNYFKMQVPRCRFKF